MREITPEQYLKIVSEAPGAKLAGELHERVKALEARIAKGIMLIEQSRGHKTKTGRNLILDDAVHALRGEPETAWVDYHKERK